ncbi:MAG: 4Fe-4S dicluster domain-containing protein [Dehalococcoidia bacterium]
MVRGTFVRLQIDASLCARQPLCRECVSSCPVDIFTRPEGKTAQVVAENEDECILCNLCLDRCPVNAVTLVRLY